MKKDNSRHNECNTKINVPEGKLCSPVVNCTTCKHGVKWNDNGTVVCEIYKQAMPPMHSCSSWVDKFQ